MTVKTLAILLVILVAMLAAAQASWADGSDQTIREIVSLPDGTSVILCLETIIRIQHDELPNYIVLQEPFHGQDKLVVLTAPNPALRLQQVVDVSGDLTTLASGARALENVTVWGYATATGQLLYHPPLIKGFGLPGETPCPKIDLTVASSPDRGRSTTHNRALDYAPPADDPTAPPEPTDYFSVDAAVDAGVANGSLIDLECEAITDAGVDEIGNYIDIADVGGLTTLRAYYNPDVCPTAASASFLNYVSGQLQDNGLGAQVLDINAGASYDPQLYVGILQPLASIDYTASPQAMADVATALAQQDGTSLTIMGRIVSATYSDFPGYLYVQDPPKTGIPFANAGIRVKYPGAKRPVRGATVNITGTIGTASDGEREIGASVLTGVTIVTAPPALPKPLGMSNICLGGSALNKYVTSITSPVAIGCYNRGLLVKACGHVTYVDPSRYYFYVSDGSYLSSGAALQDRPNGPLGVRVDCSWPAGRATVTPPEVGWYVSVIGVSGTESRTDCVGLLRVLRIRDQSDIVPTSLTVSITAPIGNIWHMASGASHIAIVGMATGPGQTGVSVKVGFATTGSDMPNAWSDPSYSASTHVWSYDWQNPQSQRIWVKATDSAGNMATAHLDVTIAPVAAIYVNGSVPTSGDGNSWNTAMKHVSYATAAASRGMEVWVAGTANTYVESATINLNAGVGLYGGFSGAETVREQRNWRTNATTLDGNNSHGVISVQSGASTTDTFIDGFTIKNGCTFYGGGICCFSSSPTISNNTIASNDGMYSGGGIYCNGASPAISYNTITGNSAGEDGAAICCEYASSPVILNNAITNNVTNPAPGGASGIYCSSCSPAISGNSITGNSGGVYCHSCPSATISGNIVAANYLTDDGDGYDDDNDDIGAGIYCYGTGASSSTVSILHNTIGGATPDQGNIASHDGGGIYCSNVTATLDCNLIQYNSAGLSQWDGWNYHSGGGLAMFYCGAGSAITNNVFAYNTCSGVSGFGGGAVFAYQSAPSVVNNTFVYNGTGSGTMPGSFTPYAFGGAIDFYGSAGLAKVVNNIFYGNLARNGNSVAVTQGATVPISYCGSYPGDSSNYYVDEALNSQLSLSGCIYVDPLLYPLLYSSGYIPYWLQPGSPLGTAQDYGMDPGPGSPVPSLDMAGMPRPGAGGTTMGAYEYEDNPACH